MRRRCSPANGATLRSSLLMCAVVAPVCFLPACSRSPVQGEAASAATEDPCPQPDRPVHVERVFTRGTGAPVEETAEFAASAGEPGQVCATPMDVKAGEVSLNGATLFDSADLKTDQTLTADVTLQQDNSLFVKLLGKPCKKPGKCATLRVRVFGTAPPPALEAAAFVSPDGCCSDPTCDRTTFAAAGGICPGDPRMAGSLPYHAVSSGAEPE